MSKNRNYRKYMVVFINFIIIIAIGFAVVNINSSNEVRKYSGIKVTYDGSSELYIDSGDYRMTLTGDWVRKMGDIKQKVFDDTFVNKTVD